MANRRLRKFFAGAVLAFAAVAVSGALPAAAATAPAAPAQSASAHATSLAQAPDTSATADTTCTPPPQNQFLMYQGSTCQSYMSVHCFSALQESTPFRPNHVLNNCGVRVWLYTEPNRGGMTLCISPGKGTGYLQKDYQWVWVSDNQNPC